MWDTESFISREDLALDTFIYLAANLQCLYIFAWLVPRLGGHKHEILKIVIPA